MQNFPTAINQLNCLNLLWFVEIKAKLKLFIQNHKVIYKCKLTNLMVAADVQEEQGKERWRWTGESEGEGGVWCSATARGGAWPPEQTEGGLTGDYSTCCQSCGQTHKQIYPRAGNLTKIKSLCFLTELF